jgi:hypothetical protein
MMSEEAYSKGLGELRANLIRLKPGQAVYDEVVAPREGQGDIHGSFINRGRMKSAC